MKKYIKIILIFLGALLVTMGVVIVVYIYVPIGHKAKMITYVNKGEYERAADEVVCVDDWTLGKNHPPFFMELDEAFEFSNYLDSVNVAQDKIDSFCIYIARVCDVMAENYDASYEDYNSAIYKLNISCQLKEAILGESHPEYLKSLLSLGYMYTNMGDDAQAEQYILKALNICKSFFDETNPEYANCLYALGYIYLRRGDYSQAERYELEALNIYKSTLGNNHYKYANSLDALGILNKRKGDYPKAEKYYLEALSIYKSVFGEKHPSYFDSLIKLGILHTETGNYAKAEHYYKEALKICKFIYGNKHPKYSDVLCDLGDIYIKKGDYAQAELYFTKALNNRRVILGETHIDCGWCMNALGGIYANMGDLHNAEKNLKGAAEICESAFGKNCYQYVSCMNSLGLLYQQMGDYTRSEQYLVEALELGKSVLGETNPDYAYFMLNIGGLYSDMEEYEKAEDYLLGALDIQKSVLGDNHPDYAVTVHNLGCLYTAQGDYAKAERYYLDAQRVIKLSLGASHPDYATSLSNLGRLYSKKNNYVKAEQYYLDALHIRKSIFDGNHPDYIRSLLDLGEMYSQKRDYAKAETYLLPVMQNYKNMFLQSTDFMTERQRSFYWEGIKDFFIITFPKFSYYYNQEKPYISSSAYDCELFVKGLLLNSSESIKRSVLESNDVALINQWNELYDIKRTILSIQDKETQSQYLSECKERAEQLEKKITESSVAYRENQAKWQVSWKDVRNHLTSNQVAIEYMDAPTNDDSIMCCALLLRDTYSYPIIIPLFEWKEVSSLINTIADNLTNKTYSYEENGEQLSQLVWSKILPYIKQGETVYFAPSGIIHQLAIEALPFDESHTMGDIFNLVRLSSTREIVTRKDEFRQSTTATLYGGIQYNMDADELLTESEAYKTTDLLASRGIESDTLNRGTITYLKGTKAEAENINALLNQNNLQVQLFTAKNANEESFKALSGKHRNILHIATHGFYWSDSTAQKKDYFSQRMLRMNSDMPSLPTIDPLNRCGLLFAGAQTAWSGHSADLPEGVQDGILTAKEISLLDLRDADIVVLSACETGKGEITGDGVFGLQRAFKQAGAQTIVMSLWPVNDAATQLLMTEFYRNWITNHQSKRDAFRNAQNTVRAKYEEPVYWAGFIMLD